VTVASSDSSTTEATVSSDFVLGFFVLAAGAPTEAFFVVAIFVL